jgi:hypothetical protein
MRKHIKKGWILVIALAILPLQAQVCCTLQGYVPGSYVPGNESGRVNVTLSNPWATKIDFITSGEIVKNPYIQQQFRTQFQFQLYHLSSIRFLQKISINSQVSKIKELISLDSYSTHLLTVRLAASLYYMSISGKSALWVNAGLPLMTEESNVNFPFEQFNESSIELGAVLPLFPSRINRNSFITFTYFKLLKENGLFQVVDQFYSRMTFDLFKNKLLTLNGGINMNTGKLKGLQSGVYQTSFEPVNYGFISSVIKLDINPKSNKYVMTVKAEYPWLRWANNRLPAGFSEFPTWEIGIAAPLNLFKQNERK